MPDETLGTIGGDRPSRTVEQPRAGVVIVHGAGIWQQDYWKPIVNALQGCLDSSAGTPTLGAVGVCYSDVINSAEASTARAITLAPRQHAFMNALLWDNLLLKIATAPPEQILKKVSSHFDPLGALGLAARPLETGLDLLARALLGKSLNQLSDQVAQTILPGGMNVAATIQDVCLYLFDDQFARKIRQELIDGLRDAQQYDEILLVSHSLGSVVAFDVLNGWTESKPRISHWFTLGCPLTKVLRLRPGTLNRLNNANVAHWYNVYDTTDIVAGALGPTFTKPGYHIHDIFIDIGSDPIGSHDYFGNRTTLKLIADAIQTIT
ncbi:MAG: hypothetical protein FJ009_03000 [Chloroflexi bacterium]|nr:hypothetical protein [Chloroflexota bacterium]